MLIESPLILLLLRRRVRVRVTFKNTALSMGIAFLFWLFGLFWSLAVIKALSDATEPETPKFHFYSDNQSAELAMLGVVSLCLTLVNIACIFVAAVLVLKVKEVAPQGSRDEMRRFWKHDIKIARDYNRTMHGDTAKNLGKQLLDELAGLPKEQVEAIVEEAAHSRQRLSISRHISESGVLDGVGNAASDSISNQYTWTPGTNTANFRRAAFRRDSISVPSDQEVEDMVYATLTAGSKLGYIDAVVRPGPRMPYRKISSTSWHGTSGPQIRSPTRMHTLEPQLDTIKESTSSLYHTQGGMHAPTGSRRFQVTPCSDDVGSSKKGRKTSKDQREK